MGKIVGAAIVSHHPGLMQTEEFRRGVGGGQDSDLIAGFRRLRERIDALKPDVLVIFDTHWFTTGYHLVDAGAHYNGSYISDEMPWYLRGEPFDYRGAPNLAWLCETVATERGIPMKAIDEPSLPRHYPTINLVKKLNVHEQVMTVGTCQNCRTNHFLESGAVIGEAIRRSDHHVMLLASGALSHKFTDIDFEQKNPRIFHPDNLSSLINYKSDLEVLKLFSEGRHDTVIARFPDEYRKIPWEGWGSHYLQMAGALGGAAWRARGQPLSEYENARGTGNIHIWFDLLSTSITEVA